MDRVGNYLRAFFNNINSIQKRHQVHIVCIVTFFPLIKILLEDDRVLMRKLVFVRLPKNSLKINVWLKWKILLSTKIPISSRSVENSSVMSHSPAAPPKFTNSAQIYLWILVPLLGEIVEILQKLME
jgi:hypothetical protein